MELRNQSSVRQKSLLLLKYCQEGDIIKVQELLSDKDVNIYYKSQSNQTILLHSICTCTSSDIFRLVLPSVKDLELKDLQGRTLIYSAISGNQTDLVKFLHKNGASLDTKDKNGVTPLCYAYRIANKETIEFLLEVCKEKDINAVHKASQKNPLHVIVSRCCVVKQNHNKINTGENINCLVKSKDSSMFCGRIQTDITELLELMQLVLKKGVSVNSLDSNGWAALHYVIHSGITEAAKLLLEYNCDVNLQTAKFHSINTNMNHALTNSIQAKTSPLHLSCKSNNMDMIKLMCSQENINFNAVDINGWSAVHYTILKGNLEAFKVLLGNNSDVNIQSCTTYKDIPAGASPLYTAIKCENIEIIPLLCKSGVDYSLHLGEYTPLSFSIVETNHPRLFKTLFQFISKSSKIDDIMQENSVLSLLQYAVNYYNFDVATFLAQNGADVNKTYSDSSSILVKAIFTVPRYGNKLDFYNTIIKQGFDVNLQDSVGNSSLHSLIPLIAPVRPGCQDHLQIANSLIQNAKFNMNLQNKTGESHLMQAIKWSTHFSYQSQCCDIIHMMIANGADCNLRDNEGNTALHHALTRIEHNFMEPIVQNLLSNCDKSIRNNKGQTALHYCVKKQQHISTFKMPHGYLFGDLMMSCFTPHDRCYEGFTLFQTAVLGLNFTFLKILLENGSFSESYIDAKFPLNAGRRFHNLTSLRFLTRRLVDHDSSLKMMKLFLKAGSSVHCEFEVVKTIWHEAVHILLSAGASFEKCHCYETSGFKTNSLTVCTNDINFISNTGSLLRDIMNVGYKFDLNILQKMDSLIPNDLLQVQPLETMCANTLRVNLYPNAWVSSKAILPKFIYQKYFGIYMD